VELLSEYDAASNRTDLKSLVGGTVDFWNEYFYDDLHRLTSVQQHGAAGGSTVADKRVDFAYNAASRWQTITRYEDLSGFELVATSTYAFDNAGRLTDLTHAKGANTLADYGWTYDVGNRITRFTSPDGSSTYTYDDTNQLVGADHTYQADETYTYDDNGNRTNTGYSTGANNRLLSDGAYNYEYDAEGNRTKRTAIATGEYVVYEWDYHNRLTAVRFKTSTGTVTKQVEYDYDLFDRRIGKRVDANGDSVYESAQRFVYDGEDIVLVFDGAGSLEQRYLHGPAVDQVLASEDALGDVLWSLPDNQGTVRDIAAYDSLTDTTTVENHRKFDAFGNITAESNAAVDFLYAYTGREWDADAELYYYRARWYDPVVGRFLSEDPIYDDYANPFRYVGNSSPNGVDPTGLAEGIPQMSADNRPWYKRWYDSARWGWRRGWRDGEFFEHPRDSHIVEVNGGIYVAPSGTRDMWVLGNLYHSFGKPIYVAAKGIAYDLPKLQLDFNRNPVGTSRSMIEGLACMPEYWDQLPQHRRQDMLVHVIIDSLVGDKLLSKLMRLRRAVPAGGAAQAPNRIFAPNPTGPRTPAEALEFAKSHGLNIPDDVTIRFMDDELFDEMFQSNPKEGYKYGVYGDQHVPGGYNKYVSWDDLLDGGKMNVVLRESVLKSDQAFLASLAHELFEIQGLRHMMTGRSLPWETYAKEVCTGIEGNLHSEAWDFSNQLLNGIYGTP
jgi:RHS repeat-associated protein